MQVVLNVKGSFRTTGSGHNREVIATGSTVYHRTGFNCENLNNCELRVFLRSQLQCN